MKLVLNSSYAVFVKFLYVI